MPRNSQKIKVSSAKESETLTLTPRECSTSEVAISKETVTENIVSMKNDGAKRYQKTKFDLKNVNKNNVVSETVKNNSVHLETFETPVAIPRLVHKIVNSKVMKKYNTTLKTDEVGQKAVDKYIESSHSSRGKYYFAPNTFQRNNATYQRFPRKTIVPETMQRANTTYQGFSRNNYTLETIQNSPKARYMNAYESVQRTNLAVQKYQGNTATRKKDQDVNTAHTQKFELDNENLKPVQSIAPTQKFNWDNFTWKSSDGTRTTKKYDWDNFILSTFETFQSFPQNYLWKNPSNGKTYPAPILQIQSRLRVAKTLKWESIIRKNNLKSMSNQNNDDALTKDEMQNIMMRTFRRCYSAPAIVRETNVLPHPIQRSKTFPQIFRSNKSILPIGKVISVEQMTPAEIAKKYAIPQPITLETAASTDNLVLGIAANHIDTSDYATLHVHNLSNIVDEYVLAELLSGYGRIVKIYFPRDKITYHTQGEGFITFAHRHDAWEARSKMNNMEVHRRCMKIEVVKTEVKFVPPTRVFAWNLPSYANSSDVMFIFQRFGQIIRKPGIIHSRGQRYDKTFSIIDFSIHENALEAVQRLNNTYLYDRVIHVNFGYPNTESDKYFGAY